VRPGSAGALLTVWQERAPDHDFATHVSEIVPATTWFKYATHRANEIEAQLLSLDPPFDTVTRA
jgi:hypothetical protein